jgi:hypothetical protein
MPRKMKGCKKTKAIKTPKVKKLKPVVTEEFYGRMLAAAKDINQYSDRLWADQDGKSFPLFTNFKVKTCLMRELINLIQGRAPVLLPNEIAAGRLCDPQTFQPLDFNFTPETWGTLRECVKQIGFHDITDKFDIMKIMRYHRSGKGKKATEANKSLATI